MVRTTFLIFLVLSALAGCSRDPAAAAKRLLETGNKYFDNGKYREASIIYRRVIQKNRLFADAYYRLGLTDLKLGRVRQAIAAFTRATELKPENQDAYAHLADLYLAAYLANPAQNETWLGELQRSTERAEQYFPGSFDINRIKAHVAFTQKDYQTAIELFRAARKQKPDDRRVNLGLVQSLAAAGDTKQAEQLAKSYLAQDKNFGAMYDSLYALYARQNRAEDARAILESKCEANPDNIAYRLQLARHYYVTRHSEEMRAALDYLTSHPEEFPTAFRDVGNFYVRIRDYDQALETYRRGTEVVPQQASDLKNRMVEVLALEGKPQEAFRLVETILKEDENNTTALALRGALRLRSGDRRELDAAIADFEAALSRMPENVVLRYNLAETYRMQGNLGRALVEYNEAIQKRADYLPPRYGRAGVYLQQKEYAKALAAGEEILKLRPNDLRARLIRCNAWIGLGQSGQARASLREILEQSPRASEALYQLARLELREHRYDEAEKLFRRLYTGSPPDRRGLFGLVDVYMAKGRTQEAIALLRTSLEREPDRPALHLAMGSVLLTSGRVEEAVKEFRFVLDKRPDDGMANRFVGFAYYQRGEFAKAEEYLKKAAELRPMDPLPVLYLGMTSERQGAMSQAAAYYEEVLKRSPDSPIALNNLAYILAETTAELDRALTLAQRARSRAPQDPNVADTLAWIYIKKNLADSAVLILNDVVAKNPSMVTWRYHLAMALFQQGETGKAKRELEIALQHQPTEEEKAKINELLAKVGS